MCVQEPCVYLLWPPLKLDLSLSQRECQAKEGEGTRLLLNLHLSLSQREYQVKEGVGTRLLLKLHLSLSQRENQVKEGEGKRLLPDLDHPPGSCSSQEIPAHHPGGQLA